MKNRKQLLVLIVLAGLLVGIGVVVSRNASAAPIAPLVEDFENPKPGAVKWKVVDYNRIQTHPARIPSKIPGGIAFDFLNAPDTALIGTSHPSYRGDLIGNMTGKTLTARIGVTVTPGTEFRYYGQGQGPVDGCGFGPPAFVRFYFETNTSGKFEETDYWWSNPTSATLVSLQTGGEQAISALMSDPSQWSNFYGHYGSDPLYNSAFNAALRDVQFVGLSFGGGCFFENGVGVQNGSGSFRLMDFTATP